MKIMIYIIANVCWEFPVSITQKVWFIMIIICKIYVIINE